MTKKTDAINYYDDEGFNYEDYWTNRDYEHLAEVTAINKLLKGRHFRLALDYGGGYGRLSEPVLKVTDKLIVSDPSTQQLDMAKAKHKSQKNVDYMLLTEEGKIPLKDKELDLLLMIRVSHHLPQIDPTFKEINRVLEKGGLAVIEIANQAHIRNRAKSYISLKGLSKDPVPVGSVANGIKDTTPFVNHNPKTIRTQLKDNNFKILKVLSVSNLRSGSVKKLIGVNSMIKVEDKLQAPLSPLLFGPSIFFLVQKLEDK
ncbi:MAG TPA: methyltransferase domain-containing protein [Candidatus Saccharimonadales bacterium]